MSESSKVEKQKVFLSEIAGDFEPEKKAIDYIANLLTYGTTEEKLQKDFEEIIDLEEKIDVSNKRPHINKLERMGEIVMGYLFLAAIKPLEEDDYIMLAEVKYNEAGHIYDIVERDYHNIMANIRKIPQMYAMVAYNKRNETKKSFRWISNVGSDVIPYVDLIRTAKYQSDHSKFKKNLPNEKNFNTDLDIAYNTSKTIDEFFIKIGLSDKLI